MVKLLNQPVARYNVRAAVSGINQIMDGTALLLYAGVYTNSSTETSSKPFITLTGLNATADTIFLNESLASPFLPVMPSETVDATFILKLDRANGSFVGEWKMTASRSL
jgi:hypothetical protein